MPPKKPTGKDIFLQVCQKPPKDTKDILIENKDDRTKEKCLGLWDDLPPKKKEDFEEYSEYCVLDDDEEAWDCPTE